MNALQISTNHADAASQPNKIDEYTEAYNQKR